MNFLFSIPAFAWLVISAIVFAVGEFLSKKFAMSPSWNYVIVIVIVYAIGSLAWLPAILQKNSLSVAGAMWSVLTLLFTVMIGVLIFNEHLGLVGTLGVVFAIIAVALLSFV
jgi:multidrug transporter EmrE-like cation transporter